MEEHTNSHRQHLDNEDGHTTVDNEAVNECLSIEHGKLLNNVDHCEEGIVQVERTKQRLFYNLNETPPVGVIISVAFQVHVATLLISRVFLYLYHIAQRIAIYQSFTVWRLDVKKHGQYEITFL